MWVQGLSVFANLLLPFQVHQQAAGLKVEQLEFETEPLWDSSVIDSEQSDLIFVKVVG